MKEKIVLFGIGKTADSISYYIERDQSFEIVAYTVTKEYISGPEYNGKPIVDFSCVEKAYNPEMYKMLITVGYQKINTIRENFYNQAKRKGYKFVNYLSSKACVDACNIGENNIILDGCIIQPKVEIGNNNIFWSQSHIGHHSVIGNHCFFASPKVSGLVTIHDNVFLGTSSIIGDNVIIGQKSLIGIGAIINKDVAEESVIIGATSKNMGIKSTLVEGILG